MARHHYYMPVTDALDKLRKEGYTLDFNIKENCLICGEQQFNVDDFRITDVYRYEGNSDPGDEATVYALESKDGLKGVLVTGYGMSYDEFTTEILKQLGAPEE